MAALTLAQVKQTFRNMLTSDPTFGTGALTKPDFQAAVSAADAWLTTNAASYVAALPEPFKSNSNAAQKALLLSAVALTRWGG